MSEIDEERLFVASQWANVRFSKEDFLGDGAELEVIDAHIAGQLCGEARAENEIAALRERVATEREACARLVERLPVGSGLTGRTYAEAIRRVGIGGKLARALEEER